MKRILLLLILGIALNTSSLTQKEANDMLHHGIRKNNPTMVKEAFQKGAQEMENDCYRPESTLVRATHRLIRTVANHDERPTQSATRFFAVGLMSGTIINRSATSLKGALIKGIPVITLASFLINKVLNKRAEAAIQKSQDILTQVLEKTPKPMEMVYKIENQKNDKEKLKLTLTAADSPRIQCLHALDLAAENSHQYKSELETARARIFNHYWEGINLKGQVEKENNRYFDFLRQIIDDPATLAEINEKKSSDNSLKS